jgi:peptidoglycan/xylan/chitin deacetylase (PgdA/CDA1 family)
MLRVALSHDVDRITKSHQFITRTWRSIYSADYRGVLNQIKDLGRSNQYWGFDEVIKIESEFGVKSTFFFLNESLRTNILSPNSWKLSMGRYNIHDRKVVNIIKWLDTNGWEIGVHGSYLSFKNLNLLISEKKTLESIVGHEIIGIRQHYINIADTTWQLQFNAGFKYDSTWGLGEEIGYRENIVKPFSPLNNSFRVIPFAVMDSCFASTPNKWDKLQTIIDQTIENDAILVINWHTNNYSELDFPDYKKNYIKIIETCIKNGAKFYTLKDYYNQILSNGH